MRALNPPASASASASELIAKLNAAEPSQHNGNSTQPNAHAPEAHADSQRRGIGTHGPPYALNPSLPSTNTSTSTTRPRPSSRHSAISSSFSQVKSASGTSRTGTLRKFASTDSLTTKAPIPTPRSAIITTTRPVAKTNRAAPPNPAINFNNNNNNNSNNTNTTPPTTIPPTRSSAPSRTTSPLPATRSPLKHRDQNGSHITPVGKTSSMSRNVKVTMPYDTRSPNPNGGRPQMPTLSAGAARGMNKPTIAPKLATKASAPTLAANAHTPLAKRIQRPATANLSTPVPLRGTSQLEDDPNGLLGLNNITPRSGKRQSRVDSASSTPNGTPIPDRHEGWDRDSSVAGAASPVGYESNTTAMPALTFSPMSSDLQLQPKPETLNDLDSKFFHASDVRSTQQTAPGPAPIKPTLARAPTFFYAVRNKIDSKPNTPASVTSVPLQKPSQDNLAGKFVYANGTPDLKPSPPTSATSRPSSVLSMASRAPTSRPLSSSQTSAQSAAQRPVSPVKLAQQPHVSFQRNEKKPSLVTNRTHANLPPQLGPPPALRRTSTGTSLSRGGHSRQSSLTIGEVELKTGFIPSGPSSPLPLASPHHQPLTFASILQAADDFGEDESVTSADNSRSEIQSPTRFSHPVEPLSDLVANARRERKVQDLQITNASLEAINRTLERQLRKQTAELRRYKRLSRAGRLSMVSSVVPSRVVSESHSTGGDIEGLALSDLDEEDSSEEFEEDDSFSDTDSASESLSPSLMAERDAKHRKKDEKRLQLDLSKHQELLIDSQKINQSIKRCMDWTEELIKEGKKALEYSVRVSDVEIPRPRVLAPRDEEEDQTQNSINFDPDAAFEEISNMIVDKEETDAGRVMPLEPRLAGWQPASMDVNGGGETLGDSP